MGLRFFVVTIIIVSLFYIGLWFLA